MLRYLSADLKNYKNLSSTQVTVYLHFLQMFFSSAVVLKPRNFRLYLLLILTISQHFENYPYYKSTIFALISEMIKGIELKFSLEYWELLTHGTILKKTSLGLDEAL